MICLPPLYFKSAVKPRHISWQGGSDKVCARLPSEIDEISPESDAIEDQRHEFCIVNALMVSYMTEEFFCST